MIKENKKIVIIRIILLLLIFANLIAIFGFSNQKGEQSSGLSSKITVFILNIFGQDNKTMEQEKIEQVEHIIRKLAHFSIYTILGILLMSFASTYKIKNTTKIFASIFTGIVYAVLDEFHQSFIPDRTPLLTDVIIDTFGVIVGCLLVIVILKKIKIK